MTDLPRRTLILLLSFGAISAIAGGILGVFFNGAGVPLEYLQGTPFTSYLAPGLILGVVIGGTQGVAAIGALRRDEYSMMAATVAGFGMIIWIFVELAITGYSWLQTFYFALGLGEVMLVLLQLGVLLKVARPGPRRSPQPNSGPLASRP
ncbi:hypothetical protein [Microbacterium sp. NPDC087665]|uniref:hypothetical protein n=1 Tax=Microbacterium sp. NPDC087665 TaxID=3364194 RepID=UPI003829FDB9